MMEDFTVEKGEELYMGIEMAGASTTVAAHPLEPIRQHRVSSRLLRPPEQNQKAFFD